MLRNPWMKTRRYAGAAAVLTASVAAMSYVVAAQQPAAGSPFAPPADAPVPAVLKAYAPVTGERLKTPEAGNWLQIHGTYDGWGYSPLDQINSKNVGQMKLVWGFATGGLGAHEAAPLV